VRDLVLGADRRDPIDGDDDIKRRAQGSWFCRGLPDRRSSQHTDERWWKSTI
jgi:hypothetical protein